MRTPDYLVARVGGALRMKPDRPSQENGRLGSPTDSSTTIPFHLHLLLIIGSRTQSTILSPQPSLANRPPLQAARREVRTYEDRVLVGCPVCCRKNGAATRARL